MIENLLFDVVSAAEPVFGPGLLGRLTDEERRVLESLPFVHTGRDAQTVWCWNCDEHDGDVDQTGPGVGTGPWIWCPRSGWLEIGGHLLRQLKIDVVGLANALAELITQEGARILIPDRLWRLGLIPGAGGTECLLIRGLLWPDGGALIEGARTRSTASQVLVMHTEPEISEFAWSLDGIRFVAATDVVGLREGGFVLRRSGTLAPRRSTRDPHGASPRRFPLGLSPRDLSIGIQEEQVVVRTRGRVYHLRREDLSLARSPELWTMLDLFAAGRGRVPAPRQPKGREAFRQRVSRLASRLRETFVLPRNAKVFAFERREDVYRALFDISRSGLRPLGLPSGVRWSDVLISLKGAASIRLAIGTPERTTRRGEVAEVRTWQDYDRSFEELSLSATYGGALSARGTLLVAVLKEKRSFKTPKGVEMTALGEVLKDLTGIEDAPFTVAVDRVTWTRLFEVGPVIA